MLWKLVSYITIGESEVSKMWTTDNPIVWLGTMLCEDYRKTGNKVAYKAISLSLRSGNTRVKDAFAFAEMIYGGK